MIGTVFEVLTAQRTRWRRTRNLRAGARAQAGAQVARAWPQLRLPLRLPLHPGMPGPLVRLGLASVLMAAAGSGVIATHARRMAAAGGEGAASDAGLAALQAALPGAAFTVPSERGVRLEDHGGTQLLILSGMAAGPSRRIDLCSQMADPARARLLPLRIGYRFDEIAALAARGETPLRNVVLSDRAMPHIEIAGQAAGGAPLALRWSGRQAHWIGDGGPAASGAGGQAGLLRQGWLLWGADGALRVLRRPSTDCPQAGELVLQPWRLAGTEGPAKRALVMAFPAAGVPAAGVPLETWLAPGDYRVPAAPPARLEDEQLFEQLRARGLVRLGAGGLAELAPPDLAAWRRSGPTAWDRAVLDEEGRRLLRHLYGRADGEFVREQVRIFNSERRLLAWRVRAADLAGAGAGSWRAETGGVPAPLARDFPAAGARLFARLPQGWAPWQRIGAWQAGAMDQERARLRLALSRPARAGDWIQLMLAGRVLGLQGARLAAAPAPACGGRACQAPDQVQVLDLQLEPGACELVLDAAPLGMDALAVPGDARYRHIVLREGRLAWRAMPAPGPAPASGLAPGLAQIRLLDRNGAALWHDGAPGDAARAAGLASLLGVRAEQASGVAGMLARLPGAGPHEARLTLDLNLQRAAQAALDCIGLRQGQWDGRACSGAGSAPEGRQAGLVVLDTETGDILAAAGAGGGNIEDADWRELRDFDRVDPAASPLRLPAWQHDGGAQRSPGSTFKIVSALGLELAARSDPRLDTLLEGQTLAGINRLAQERGFDFRTDAPSYPVGARARITNFRDQGLDRRAHDGRLGLAQALTYSLNTWFAWTGELSDRSLFGAPSGGVPDLQPLQAGALDDIRPIVAMARRLGFGEPVRLDGGLLPPDYPWSAWDALQATPAGIDPVHTRHELRQMAIGLRMQATPLQMALVAGAVGQGRTIQPRLLAELDGRPAEPTAGTALGVRLDRVRAGMKGVVDAGTAAGAFRGADLARVRRGLSGKTGTAPVGDGSLATVWFTGWLEPGSIPGQAHRLALAVFVSQSEGTGGGHAAPVAAAVLGHLSRQDAKP